MQISKEPIVIGSDHAGVETKKFIMNLLDAYNIKYEDVGSYDPNVSVDYPVYAKKVADIVMERGIKGILVCGSGTGMAIAANKVNGIRASFSFDAYSAKMARHDNDANVLTLRGREFPTSEIKVIVETWLSTPFSGIDRHIHRIKEVHQMEKNAVVDMIKKRNNKRVIPSVFSTDEKEFAKRFNLTASIAKYIHIDIMDGEFVKVNSIPPSSIPNLKEYDALFEAHLMVSVPRAFFPLLKEKGFKRVIFHIESHKDRYDLQKTIDEANSMNLRPMIAINPNTPLDELLPFVNDIDGVLFMGVMPGAEKQPFIESDYVRIEKFRKANKKIWIQVDGGVTPSVAQKLTKIGVNAVNSGSYVSASADPKHALKELEHIMKSV